MVVVAWGATVNVITVVSGEGGVLVMGGEVHGARRLCRREADTGPRDD